MNAEDKVIGVIMAVICLLAGGFCIFCSVMNYDWFFNNHKAAPLMKIFGRNGTRIFYICLGIFICIVAVIGVVGALIG